MPPPAQPSPLDLHIRRSGVLLHPTSLPGPHGSGDFGPSAYHFVDWLCSAGQSLWQVLPLNPIGPGHSPYAGVSAFAGNPWLVALEPLVAKGWLTLPPLDAANVGFDARHVAFGSVIPWRMAALRAAWDGFQRQADVAERTALAAYAQAEQPWLDDYTLFMALDHAFNPPGAEFRAWPAWPGGLSRREPQALQEARRSHADDIAFWQFVQWCFDSQWQALRNYARDRGIAIVGDLPIFIAHHSADCWARPDLYWLDDACQPTVVAGVPPDYFSETGQRWGNPLYRWDRFAQEDFAWWVARMRRQLALADAVRIDHFRGFAAYWEIPASAPTAVGGRWVAGPGEKLFEALQAALGSLPVIAEDLGVITPDVAALRDGLGLPGMRILQFAFGDTADNPYLPHNHLANTVVYSGTHDNDTSRGWWAHASEKEQAYARQYLACGEAPSAWPLVRAAMASVANTAVVPMQDALDLDSTHRMNTPGLMGAWAWRFSWDQVDSEPAARLKALALAFGRWPGAI